MSFKIESQQTEDIVPSADMAEETSDQQTEKIGPIADMAQEISDEQPGFVFDETKRYHPLFYLTDISDGVRLFFRPRVLSL